MRTRPLSLAVGLFAVAAITLSGCSTAPSGSADEPAAPETRVVQTDQGPVTVPGEPERVVVLNYALAGYLYNLDVPVAATTSEDFDYEPQFSEMWGDAPQEDGTEFLDWGMDGFDYEAILELDPDLIVAGGVGLPNGLAVTGYEQLSQIAPTVIVSGSLTTWQEQFSFIAGELLGRQDDYDGFVTAYQTRVAEVEAAITLPPTPVATLTVTADGTPYLLLDDQGLPQTLASLGLAPAPIVADNGLEPYTAGGDMAELSTEQVGQLLAEVPTVFITGFNSDTTDVATLSGQAVWAALDSFAADHAYDLPYWVVRGDYDETLALLYIIEQLFS